MNAIIKTRTDAINALRNHGITVVPMPIKPRERTIEELIANPQNWSDDEWRRVVECSKSSDYEDMHNDMFDAISDNRYYDQEAETEREQNEADADYRTYGDPTFSARARNGGRF